MDFNFPLILLVATAVTGVIALIDLLWLKKIRLAKAAELQQSGADEITVESAREESFLVENAKSFFPVLAIIFVLRSFIAEPFQIPSGSMEPGLIPGDFILVSKYSYGLRMPVWGNVLIPTGEPQRGDVMVFFPPDNPRYFIKRVIGLPGDHIEYYEGRLSVNGEAVPLEELGGEPSYNPTKYLLSETMNGEPHDIQWLLQKSPYSDRVGVLLGPEGEWDVPAGHYFMMGDNRGNSGDSRMFGFVPENNIVGRAEAVWMHWESWSKLPSFSRNKAIE